MDYNCTTLKFRVSDAQYDKYFFRSAVEELRYEDGCLDASVTFKDYIVKIIITHEWRKRTQKSFIRLIRESSSENGLSLYYEDTV